MLKIVPDPPLSTHSLEDTLLHASEYALCAQAGAQQALQIEQRSPSGLLIAAAIHEIEAMRQMLGSALARVQKPVESQMQR